MRTIATLMSVLLLSACGGGGGGGGGSDGGTPPEPATPGIASTGCGRYQGVDRGASWSFLGIRYAAAPTGALRWKSPASPTISPVEPCELPPQWMNTSTGARPDGNPDFGAYTFSARQSSSPVTAPVAWSSCGQADGKLAACTTSVGQVGEAGDFQRSAPVGAAA